KRRRLFLIERRQAFPLAPRFAQFHAPADDFRDRKPRPQLIKKLRRESHGDSGSLAQERLKYMAPGEPAWVGRPCPGYPQAWDKSSGRHPGLPRSGKSGIHNPGTGAMDSGFASFAHAPE